MLAQDDGGARWTQVTTDLGGVATAQSLWNDSIVYPYEPPEGSVVATRAGWPVDCGLRLGYLDPPHDPPGVPAGEVLRPLPRE